MRAVICPQYGPPNVLRIADRPKPKPRHKDVLVKVHATAVTASDVRLRAFRFPLNRPIGLLIRAAVGILRPRNPVLGNIFAGTVETVGAQVTKFNPGDQVFGMTAFEFGAYAEYVRVPVERAIAQKPASISFEDAAAAAYGTLIGSHFLKKTAIEQRESVLIYGASGAIGTATVQLANHYGANVTAVCSGVNAEWVGSLGAKHVIDYTAVDEIPEAQTYDLVFDAVGEDKRSQLKLSAEKALNPGGVYISVDHGMPTAKSETLELVARLMEQGEFRAIVDRQYPLEEIVESHAYVDGGHKKGNVVVTFE